LSTPEPVPTISLRMFPRVAGSISRARNIALPPSCTQDGTRELTVELAG
jgi:hypothetical protein